MDWITRMSKALLAASCDPFLVQQFSARLLSSVISRGCWERYGSISSVFLLWGEVGS